MKTKFLNALKEKCKDMGLSKKALDELTEIGSASLTDESTDEDITKAVDSVVPFAKAMQAETTRKTSKQKAQSAKQSDTNEGGEGDEKKDDDKSEMPEWMKKFSNRLDALEQENADLKAEKARSERASLIAEKAKSLGIPEYLYKRISFADDADVDAELEAFAQDLVNNNLMPKDHAHETGSTEDQDRAEAEAWAATLADRK